MMTDMTQISTPRRRMVGAGLAAAGATLLPGSSTLAAMLDSPKPLKILILGGTGFTGPHQVRYALERGHKLTLFNRGRRPKEWPAHVDEVVGDRDTNDYASLKEGEWDVCIDNPTSVPAWVRDAGAVLKGRVKHYIFISTVSVYAGPDAFAETTATMRKNMALYGPLKALSEDEAHKQFPGATTIIRPGLIVGPGDETDRFTYWPVRLARGGKTLVPPLVDPVQFIDARDLAEWTIRLAEQRVLGTFNGFGPASPMTTGQMLQTIRHATGDKAELVEASQKFLDDNKVEAWSDLPVWVPGNGETAGFHRRSNQRALSSGLSVRPLAQTVSDTLQWWGTQDEKRRATLRAGLKPEREAELLALLAKA